MHGGRVGWSGRSSGARGLVSVVSVTARGEGKAARAGSEEAEADSEAAAWTMRTALPGSRCSRCPPHNTRTPPLGPHHRSRRRSHSCTRRCSPPREEAAMLVAVAALVALMEQPRRAPSFRSLRNLSPEYRRSLRERTHGGGRITGSTLTRVCHMQPRSRAERADARRHATTISHIPSHALRRRSHYRRHSRSRSCTAHAVAVGVPTVGLAATPVA